MIAVRRVKPARYVVAICVACLLWGSPRLIFSHMAFAGTVDNSGPFTITASTFTITNVRIDQSVIQQGGSLADALVMDVVATNLVISKQVFLPGTGPTTFSTAATGSEPARLYGLRAHIVSLTSAQGNFSSLADILSGKQQIPGASAGQSNIVTEPTGVSPASNGSATPTTSSDDGSDSQEIGDATRQSASRPQEPNGPISNIDHSAPTVITSPGAAIATTAIATPAGTVGAQSTPALTPTPTEGGAAQVEATPVVSQPQPASAGNAPTGTGPVGAAGLSGNLSTLSLTLTDVRIQATFLVVQAATLPGVVISVH
ncbi:hypothetical protein KDH_51770 [Dictyobacter sp. S3.2.2.5]|uniref:CHRD domain-containing protein n=1 Tax=Dictyobacter halimunensis TaxID=3026934 RepID=A0ABQ6FVR2_9CHLR|nr:hypothetical protein KDH_51770 [Dictyobacter sp. S3.2.2.5]